MAPVPWTEIERFFKEAFGNSGDVAREDVINLAFTENASDDAIDTIDAIGSRVFTSIEDAKAFLQGQSLITD